VSDPIWLRIVRLRAQRRVLWSRELWARHHYVDEQALAITHSEVERALAAPAQALADEQAFFAESPPAAALSAELEALERAGRDPRWEQLTGMFELTQAESALLACALAAELCPPLRRVFGYLQDEVAPLDASPAIVAALWGMPAPPVIGAQSRLVRWRLARPLDPSREPESSVNGWIADPGLLGHLGGLGHLVRLGASEGEAATGSLLGTALLAPKTPVLFADELDGITGFVSELAGGAEGVEIELVAPPGSGRATLAAQVARRLGRGLVTVDCRAIAGDADPATAAVRELRQAELDGALIAWRDADALPAPALAAVSGRAQLMFLTTQTPLRSAPRAGVLRRAYELPPLDRAQRLALWEALGTGAAPAPVGDWALRAGEVVAASQAISAGPEAVRDVCKRLMFETPSELIKPLRLPYTWGDLVVSDHLLAHLRELETQAVARSEVLDGWGLARLAPLGRGVSAMFAGPSGVGKTMAAQVLARELGLELLRVDLAGVVNKYIGETEKHLRAVFAACERAPVMLFFDEADALFGKRMQVSDAHDRFANIEVDYLLQRMEEFDGIAVLATNRKGDIDTAFLRRLSFVIDFAPPTVAERERLWRLALAASRDGDGRPLVDELDWHGLARDLDLTGAGIKASALSAAFLARAEGCRIGARHIVAAARRELQKQGVVVRVGQLERSGSGDGAGRNGAAAPLSAGEIEQMVNGGPR
jgi:hypothetical protein